MLRSEIGVAPQHTSHWSAVKPVVHMGPVDDCPACEDERIMRGEN